MGLDAGDQGGNVLLADGRAEPLGERLAGQFRRTDEEIEAKRRQRHGDDDGAGEAARAEAAGRVVDFRLVAGTEQAAGDLGARGVRLGRADDAAVEVTFHLAKLVAIDRQRLGALGARRTHAPVERRQHRKRRGGRENGHGDPERNHGASGGQYLRRLCHHRRHRVAQGRWTTGQPTVCQLPSALRQAVPRPVSGCPSMVITWIYSRHVVSLTL